MYYSQKNKRTESTSPFSYSLALIIDNGFILWSTNNGTIADIVVANKTKPKSIKIRLGLIDIILILLILTLLILIIELINNYRLNPTVENKKK